MHRFNMKLALSALVVFAVAGCSFSSTITVTDPPLSPLQPAFTPEQILNAADYLVHMEVRVFHPQLGEIGVIMAGFVVEDNGRWVIVTASHIKPVGGEVLQIDVYFHNRVQKRPEPFQLVGYDRHYDTAVLRPLDPNFVFTGRTARFGDFGAVYIGMPVVALGSPYGLPYQYAAGHVLYIRRTVHVEEMPYRLVVMEHDSNTMPGFSGGPTLNLQGEVIGMEVAGYVGGGLRLADAMPIDDIRRILPNLIAGGCCD